MAQLKEIATIVKNNIQSKELTEIGDLKFVTPKQIINENSIDWDSCLMISSDNKKVKGIVTKGDIVIVNVGVKCGLIYKHDLDTPFITNINLFVIKPRSTDLYDALINRRNYINNLIKRGTINHLYLKDLSELEF